MSGKVAVLGCGPAGLMAVHAAALADCDVHLYSSPDKSVLRGAQYLHAAVPGVTSVEADGIINYIMEGSLEDYRRKVYGDKEANVLPSPGLLLPQHAGWDLRVAYERLWSAYGSYVLPSRINARWLAELLASSDYDLVISTIPLPAICKNENHNFRTCPIWAVAGSAFSVLSNLPENTVQCNGEKEPAWYRAANVFGFCSLEWPGDHKPPISSVVHVEKPVRTNCDCYSAPEQGQPKVLLMGRYGTWTKGVLTHQAFEETEAACTEFNNNR